MLCVSFYVQHKKHSALTAKIAYEKRIAPNLDSILTRMSASIEQKEESIKDIQETKNIFLAVF